MSSCRELYPEEQILVSFFEEIGLDIDFKRRGELFSDMEKTGARAELGKAREKIQSLYFLLRKKCSEEPITELLTNKQDVLREIGIEFKEDIDRYCLERARILKENETPPITTYKELLELIKQDLQKAQNAIKTKNCP